MNNKRKIMRDYPIGAKVIAVKDIESSDVYIKSDNEGEIVGYSNDDSVTVRFGDIFHTIHSYKLSSIFVMNQREQYKRNLQDERISEELKSQTKEQIQDPLVGKWFHSFTDDGKVKWQGQVINKVNDSYYTVQLYEWLMGDPIHVKLVGLQSMEEWNFYESNDEMTTTYKLKYEKKQSN